MGSDIAGCCVQVAALQPESSHNLPSAGNVAWHAEMLSGTAVAQADVYQAFEQGWEIPRLSQQTRVQWIHGETLSQS